MTDMTATPAATEPLQPLRALIYVPASERNQHSKGGSNAAGVGVGAGADVSDLSVLDQLLLPHTVEFIPISDIKSTWQVIRTMQVRGAPLIALTAVLGLAVHLQRYAATELADGDTDAANSTNAVVSYLQEKVDYLATSRPTAVNLFHALHEIQQTVRAVVAAAPNDVSIRDRVVQAVVQQAEAMLAQDIADCHALAHHGADEILSLPSVRLQPNTGSTANVTIVTICNTGSLATAGWGTALGVVRAIHETHARLQRIVALETRPYNQGSRLTCLECRHHQFPDPLLICDSMLSAYMRDHKVTACVVGADRVAANGDTANKIGTYQLAVVAAAHNIPVYVAAPTTTLDVTTATGSDIVIEERPADELRLSSQAPADMPVWNPAFDVTPANLIAGIITEKGMIKPNKDGAFDVHAFLAAALTEPSSLVTSDSSTSVPISTVTPNEYTEQTISSLPQFLAKHVPKAMQVLGASSADDLECVEMGDGNLNLVFIVSNKKAVDSSGVASVKLIVKQALPYVRCVGESWPLTLERAFFEYTALVTQKEASPNFVPNLYYFSKRDALMVMEYLAPPIQILRKGLIQGVTYPTMAADMGTFCAQTLFRASGFRLGTTELRKKVEFWSRNTEMCALTEQVVFTEPYIVAANNRWTAPQLDTSKAAIEADADLKAAAAVYKLKFVTQTETLIHADLHSGSVMCAPDPPHQTFVIDPEFAFYGPAAFDIGAFVANLFLSYVSQHGHRPADEAYAEWVLQQIVVFWQTFRNTFTELWNDPTEHVGFVYDRNVIGANEDASADVTVSACQATYFETLLSDTLGFAGMKMLRRIVGIAHVDDLESITDVNVRAQCEIRGLAIAKAFIKSAASFATMEQAVQLARDTPIE